MPTATTSPTRPRTPAASVHRSQTQQDYAHSHPHHHHHKYSRSRSNSGYETDASASHLHIPHHIRATSDSWRNMTETYAWVLEEEGKQSWGRGETTRKRRYDSAPRWEDVLYAYELEAEEWMRQQQDARRRIVERERARTLLIREELRRVEERIRQRREAEKRRLAEERYRVLLELSRHEKRGIAQAWDVYEELWAALVSSSDPLGFDDIPWPTLTGVLSLSSIKSFLLSSAHSEGQSRKDRIRSAQLRWHPDKFNKILKRVREEDQEAAAEGAGIVARCVNEMMND